MSDLTPLTFADFSPLIGKTFRLRAENGECKVLLKEGQESTRYAWKSAARTPFSLIFSAPVGTSIQQGMYTLDLEDLGELPVFLVPVGVEEGAVQLEAVFN